MNLEDVWEKSIATIVVGCVALVALLVVGVIVLVVLAPFSNTGITQIDGYIVRTSQQSFPWEATTIKFTIEHPTSIVDAEYYSRTYGGHHEFELGTRYRITAYREWCWWYPKIVEVEILESQF